LSSSTSETSAPTSDDTLINASRSSSDGTSSTQTPSSVGKSPVTLMPNVSGTPVNPLVAAGLIPNSLEDFLQVPQRKQGGTRTRVVTKARVITGEEYMEELQKKEREVKEEVKQKRKEEREQKRKEKEEEKERKQKIREEKTLEIAQKSNGRSRGRSGTTVTIPTTSNQHEAESSSTSSMLRRTGLHIPTTKAVDTYDVLSGSLDEEDDACLLCGKDTASRADKWQRRLDYLPKL